MPLTISDPLRKEIIICDVCQATPAVWEIDNLTGFSITYGGNPTISLCITCYQTQPKSGKRIR
jgi:hypothetical protein